MVPGRRGRCCGEVSAGKGRVHGGREAAELPGGRAGDPGALEHPRVLLLNDLRELFSF